MVSGLLRGSKPKQSPMSEATSYPAGRRKYRASRGKERFPDISSPFPDQRGSEKQPNV